MTAPDVTLFASTGRSALPPAAPEVTPHQPAVTGAAAGTLHLTPDEEDAVAGYVGRVWHGATGLADAPSREMLSTLVGLTLRKAREAVAGRTSHLNSQGM